MVWGFVKSPPPPDPPATHLDSMRIPSSCLPPQIWPLGKTLHLPVKSRIMALLLRTSYITCKFLKFYTYITQVLGLEERPVSGKYWDTMGHDIYFSPKQGQPLALSSGNRTVTFWRLPELIRILFRAGKGEAKKVLPSPWLVFSLVPQVPWSMYTCLFPLSPRRTKRSTQLQCCGPAKWAPSLTYGGMETTQRWVSLPRGI